MADGTLTNTTIASTYKSLLKVKGGANTILDGDIQIIEDGDGVDSVLGLATDSALINGDGNRLYFYDADGDEHISADASGVLSIAAGAEIDLTATAVDLNGTLDVSGTVSASGAVTFLSTLDVGDRADSPTYAFEVKSSNASLMKVTDVNNTIFEIVRGGSNHIEIGTTTSHNLGFKTAGTERMSIASGGDVTFTGDLIMADGKGIDFSADASPAAGMTAEILDDYEEGTWDAAIYGGANPMVMHGALDEGYYTKIGNIVTFSGYFNSTSLGSASGDVYIAGLPFTVVNNYSARTAGVVGYGGGFNITAGHTVSCYMGENSTTVNFQIWNVTTGTSAMQASEWTLDGLVFISGIYRAA